jgi:hypothetical protein
MFSNPRNRNYPGIKELQLFHEIVRISIVGHYHYFIYIKISSGFVLLKPPTLLYHFHIIDFYLCILVGGAS